MVAHHDLTRMQTRAHLNLDAEVASGLFGNFAERALHSERRITGPDSVILMRYRRAEQRHDAVAQYLVDGAFVAVHGTASSPRWSGRGFAAHPPGRRPG